MLISTGKSLSFNSPKEGISVRLAFTNEAQPYQVWAFSTTSAPSLAPSPIPSPRVGSRMHRLDPVRVGIAGGAVVLCVALACALWRAINAEAKPSAKKRRKRDLVLEAEVRLPTMKDTIFYLME